jgi:hypothetical protein
MPTVQKMMRCPKCKRKTLHIQQAPNHILHLLLTVVTAGLWLIAWVLFVGKSDPQYTECGRTKGLLG